MIQNKDSIAKKTSTKSFNKIYLSKKQKKKKISKIPKKKWLKNYLDASKIKDIDVVVELIGGSEGAAKKLVFNSNKK